jgi:response regulator of citrate/malate metabolism
LAKPPKKSAKAKVTRPTPTLLTTQTAQAERAQTAVPVQDNPAQTVLDSAQIAEELIASGITAQPVEIVMAVLAASREGASINAAAKASGINYRTAQRIVEAATKRQDHQLTAVG